MDVTPRVPCPHCQDPAARWTLTSVVGGRDLGIIRVRIYACTSCNARMYTHEDLVNFQAATVLTPQGARHPGRKARFDEISCPNCNRERWTLTDTHPEPPEDTRRTGNLRAFVSRCDHCAHVMHSRERLRGITPEPTPRSSRSHRPHEYL